MNERDGAAEARARWLDAASLAAWPAVTTLDIDGWLLRFAGGYTKRANSATPLAPAVGDDPARTIAAVEAAYRTRGLPPIVRLPSFAPAALDSLLADRGYRLLDPSLVLARPLDAADRTAAASLRAVGDADAWLAAHDALAGPRPAAATAAHRRILRLLPGRPCFAALADPVDGRLVAAGLGVLVEGRLGVFDVVTDPTRRRRGHARRLLGALLAWGVAAGAEEAFLQVVAANAPARRLYDGLGFRLAYRYHYRAPETPPAP